MTTKQRHALDHAWTQLQAACEKRGRMVSAGELAQEMGVSRNTAWQRIMSMLEFETIECASRTRGNMTQWRYGIAGFTPKWGQK